MQVIDKMAEKCATLVYPSIAKRPEKINHIDRAYRAITELSPEIARKIQKEMFLKTSSLGSL